MQWMGAAFRLGVRSLHVREPLQPVLSLFVNEPYATAHRILHWQRNRPRNRRR